MWISGGAALSSVLVVLSGASARPEADRSEASSKPAADRKHVTGKAEGKMGRVRLYWDRHGIFRPGRPLEVLAGHPHLDGALVAAVWGEIETKQGTFDFSGLEAEIAWWAERGKRVLLHTGPYALATKRPPTPSWIYDKGVSAIEFRAHPRRRFIVKLPKVWDSPAFMKHYGAFVAALAKRYDGDPRIGHVWMGVGHLGYTTAAAVRPGAAALQEAGWTPQKWEAYINAVVDLFTSRFTKTPTLLAVSPGWVVTYKDDDIVPAMRRIVKRVIERGGSLMINGLDPDPDMYARRPFSKILDSIADAKLPRDFALFIRDDWPLWVGGGRRGRNRWEMGRDEKGFQRALKTALAEWDRLGRRCDLALVVLFPEMQATTPDHPQYQREVAAILKTFLTAGGKTDHGKP